MAGKYTLQKPGQRINDILNFFNDLTLPSATGFVDYCNNLIDASGDVGGIKTFTNNITFSGSQTLFNNSVTNINSTQLNINSAQTYFTTPTTFRASVVIENGSTLINSGYSSFGQAYFAGNVDFAYKANFNYGAYFTRINPNDNYYGLVCPDTSMWTKNKTIITNEDVLPYYSINTPSIAELVDFINTNNLNNKIIVLLIQGTSYIGCFKMTGPTSGYFDFRVIGSEERYYSRNTIDLTNKTFSDIFDTPYLNNYAVDKTVVHLSNNETINGNKTFEGLTTFDNMAFFLDGLEISNNTNIYRNTPGSFLVQWTDDGINYNAYLNFPNVGSSDNPKTLATKDNQYEEVTYSALKVLRDNSQLVPGKFYRITDYTCTTSASYTYSAGNVFDIIVRADSVNKLNEEASAVLHEGDTYFANCKLEAWRLWYCLDNDTNRFDWAKSSGTGVIYRMIDEFGNDCPYDFKNIQFTESGKYTKAYTFSQQSGSTILDASIYRNKYCHNNIMKPYVVSNKQKLNFNVFYATSSWFDCDRNVFDFDCHNNTISGSCHNNLFNKYCYSIVCGSYCTYNTFDDYCGNIVLGSSCEYNTFGKYCTNITFGTSSSVINYCEYITIDSGCNSLYITCADTSASSANYLKNVHIHLGVRGTNPNNRKTITIPDRNLQYETNIVAAGTTTIEV